MLFKGSRLVLLTGNSLSYSSYVSFIVFRWCKIYFSSTDIVCLGAWGAQARFSHSEFKSFLGPSDLSPLRPGWLMSRAHCCPCPLPQPLSPYLPHHQGASLSDRPPRPLWWWPYLLYALSVWKDKGESYLNSRDAHTLSRLQLNEKHLLFTERPSLVCSCNPLILQIETKNWSDFFRFI